MSVRVVIVDDDPEALCLLRSIVSELSYAEIVGQAENAAKAIEIVKTTNPEAVFLDINLPDMNGIELAKKLQDYDPNLYVVFVTARTEFSLDAYRLYAYDYIIKPIDGNRIITTLRRIQQLAKLFTRQQLTGTRARIAVRDGDEIILVDPETIYYVEKISRKTAIHASSGTFETSESLSELEDKLGKEFFRSHKSYMINVSKVDRILTSEKLTSYQIKFQGYPYEALLSRHRFNDLFKKIKS